MDLSQAATAALPTVVMAVIGFLFKDALSGIKASISALVTEVKEIRKDLSELAVLRVRVERLEVLEERVRDLESQAGRWGA